MFARGQLKIESPGEPEAKDVVSEALSSIGLYLEGDLDDGDEEFWLWPENEDAFWLWLSIQTQWVVGVRGLSGLNYAGVEACMRMRGIRKKSRPRLFDLIQVMERSAIEAVT